MSNVKIDVNAAEVFASFKEFDTMHLMGFLIIVFAGMFIWTSQRTKKFLKDELNKKEKFFKEELNKKDDIIASKDKRIAALNRKLNKKK